MIDKSNDMTFAKKDVLKKARELATPIDFDKLIAEGVLIKKGDWYQVLDMNKLPEHAKAQINEFASDGKVKFAKITKSAEKLVKKLSK